MTHVLQFFILRLRLRSTAKDRSFSGPNIRLRPKVKMAPTVQHCFKDPKPKAGVLTKDKTNDSRFFLRVGHQITYASSRYHHFFTGADKNWAHFQSQKFQNISLLKVGLLVQHCSKKKIQKDPMDFCC